MTATLDGTLPLRALVSALEAQLQEAGIATSRAEAEWLLADTLGLQRTELYLWDQPIPQDRLELMSQRLARRLDGEPLQYVLGSCDFFGHRVAVSPGVFIPRPETEILAQEAVAWLRQRVAEGMAAPRALDLGTGSGCLAISLAKAVPTCTVVAVELSWKALQAARTNVVAHRVEHRISIVQADWTAGLGGRFDLIMSNPPYVPDDEVWRVHGRPSDPELSLRGGPDGMAFHRRLLAEAPQLLAPGGALLMECAEAQARLLQDMVTTASWAKTATMYHDLAGRPRGLFIESAT